MYQYLHVCRWYSVMSSLILETEINSCYKLNAVSHLFISLYTIPKQPTKPNNTSLIIYQSSDNRNCLILNSFIDE